MQKPVGQIARLEKNSGIIVTVIVIGLFLILQLPIKPEPDREIIYITSVVMGVLIFLWHKLRLPISLMNKTFVESLLGVVAIAIIVHVSGGTTSYFNFLYILPNLGTATSSSKWHALGILLITLIFLFAEALFFPKPSSLNFAILNIWAVGLVSIYGRFLSKDVETARGAATEASVEKEKAVNKLKDEFVFVISHEIRGPITSIRGYLEIFLNGSNLTAPAKNLGNLAFKQSEKLNNLILQLLDLSRLETGKFKLSNENFDLNQFLHEVLDISKVEAQEKKIKFSFNPSKSRIIVFADKERVKEIILNLVENAVKYTDESGQVWIWSEVKDKVAYVSVADTGVGISKEELPLVFTRFHKSATSSTGGEAIKKSKSVGLGLYLTKQLVDKLNGKIFVESKLEKGSKFTFTLPLSKKEK